MRTTRKLDTMRENSNIYSKHRSWEIDRSLLQLSTPKSISRMKKNTIELFSHLSLTSRSPSGFKGLKRDVYENKRAKSRSFNASNTRVRPFISVLPKIKRPPLVQIQKPVIESKQKRKANHHDRIHPQIPHISVKDYDNKLDQIRKQEESLQPLVVPTTLKEAGYYIAELRNFHYSQEQTSHGLKFKEQFKTMYFTFCRQKEFRASIFAPQNKPIPLNLRKGTSLKYLFLDLDETLVFCEKVPKPDPETLNFYGQNGEDIFVIKLT